MTHIFRSMAFWWYSDPDHKGYVLVAFAMAAFSLMFGFGAAQSGFGYWSVLIGIFAIPISLIFVAVMIAPVCCIVWLAIHIFDWLVRVNKRVREWALRGE